MSENHENGAYDYKLLPHHQYHYLDNNNKATFKRTVCLPWETGASWIQR